MTQNRFPSRAEVLRRRRLAAGSLGAEHAEASPEPEPEAEQGVPSEATEAEQGQDWGTPEAEPGEPPERALISFPPKRPYWR